MGGASTPTSLMPQLVQAVIPPQHDAFVDSKGKGSLKLQWSFEASRLEM